jgi:integrase
MSKIIRSNDGELTITIRKYQNHSVIQLRHNGEKKVVKKYRMTFKEFAPTALKHINRAVRADTIKDRKSRVERFLLPYFGKKELRTISALQVEDWQYNFLKMKGADQTKRTKQLLRQILDRATVHGLVKTNVVIATSTIREPRVDNREVYTKADIKKMLNGSDGWLNLFILTMVSLGLRSGEIIGLKFSDIDFIEGTIRVQRSIRFGVISTTKTGVSRVVEIPTSLIDKLRVAYQNRRTNQEYVFINSKNQYWGDCSSITGRYFKPLLERVGVDYKTLYSLRHTYATLSLQGGQSVNYVSKQLGHADTTTTLQYYVKYLKDDESIVRADNKLAS